MPEPREDDQERSMKKVTGIGGIFFKSPNQQQAKEWYAKHLGLEKSEHGVILPWREKRKPSMNTNSFWAILRLR